MSGLPPVPLWIWQDWLTTIITAIIVFVFLYFPLSLAQAALVVRWLVHPFRKPIAPAVPGRKIAVVICTNGKATQTVETILNTLRGYRVPQVHLYVLKETYDAFRYSADEVVVPAEYQTPNRSWTKERALHYFSEWSKREGWGPETYVLHLDDDSVVDYEYLLFVLGMDAALGQGTIRLRAHGKHLLSTLADFIRIVDCETWCRFFNTRGKPKAVHGEGLVIRADVEQEVGWDYATYCGEDFLLGQLATKKGYAFEHIPASIYIAPPLGVRDFWKQRRRWFWGVVSVTPRLWREQRRSTVVWVNYRYAVGWTGFAGFGLFLYTLAYHVHFPVWLAGIALWNMAVYFAAYQVGAAKTNMRYMPLMFALQLAVAMYEGVALPYSLIFRPDPKTFDTVQKA